MPSSQSPEKSSEKSPPKKSKRKTVKEKESSTSIKKRRRSHNSGAARTLKETLSECREDIIKMKDPEKIQSALRLYNEYDDVKIPMPSDHDLLQQPFERVSMENRNTRSSSKLQSLFSISAKAARIKKKRGSSKSGQISGRPTHPVAPWKIPEVVRDRMSLIGVCIAIHEIACYLSAILTGLLLWQAFVSFAWSPQKGTITFNWVYNWFYQPLSTFAVVISTLGFLLRVDLNSGRNFRKFLLFLFLSVILLFTFYAKKGFDLTDLESYHKNLSSHAVKNNTESRTNHGSFNESSNKLILLILTSLSAIVATVISLYLHFHRHSFYLVRNDQDQDEREEVKLGENTQGKY